MNLFEAVENNNIEEVRKFLESGADVNAKDEDGNSPLHLVAEKGNKEIAELFIFKCADINADVNAVNENTETPLHKAAFYGKKKIVELLISHGADINARDKEERTPIVKTCMNPLGKLRDDYNPDYDPDYDPGFGTPNAEGWSNDYYPMDNFEKEAKEIIAKLLIAKGANVNTRDNRSFSPLHHASFEDLEAVAEMLIANGADVQAKNWRSETPLHLGVEEGQWRVTNLLISKGADVNAKDKAEITPLLLAVDKRHKEIAELLIAKGADVNAKDENENTPLHCAAFSGCTKIAELLVSNGADVNAKDENGSTPLHDAATLGHKEMAGLLISHGADINARDKEEMTPLHRAVDKRHKEIAELLIAKGADVNAKDEDENTPFHYAAFSGCTKIAELLVSNGADVNAKDKAEITPLHRAVEKSHKEIADLLIANGADVNTEDDIAADLQEPLEEKSQAPKKQPGFFRQVAGYFWGERDELSSNTSFKDGVYLIFIAMVFCSMVLWDKGQPLFIIPCALVILVSFLNKFWVNTGIIAAILIIDGYFFAQSWPQFWYMHVILQWMGVFYLFKCFMAGKFSKGSLVTDSKEDSEVSEEAVNDLAQKIAWSITQSEIDKGNLKVSDEAGVNRTHVNEAASVLLANAATFFNTIGEQKASLKYQLEENAKVFLQVAHLVEKDPTGILEGDNGKETHCSLAAKLLRDAAVFIQNVGEQNDYLTDRMEEKAKVFLQVADLVETSPQAKIGDEADVGESHSSEDEDFKAVLLGAENGDAFAQFMLGARYASGDGVEQSDEEHLKWWLRSAENGYAQAQYEIGLKYDFGHGVEHSDEEAVKWYRLAAEQGHAQAQNNLAAAYSKGEGVEQDHLLALKWYKLSAEQGDELAQLTMGFMYSNGQVVDQDMDEALKWYRLSAEQNCAPAQVDLGFMYAAGHGVVPDFVEAYKWLLLAEANGYNGVMLEKKDQVKSMLEEEMSIEQIEEAKRRIREWMGNKGESEKDREGVTLGNHWACFDDNIDLDKFCMEIAKTEEYVTGEKVEVKDENGEIKPGQIILAKTHPKTDLRGLVVIANETDDNGEAVGKIMTAYPFASKGIKYKADIESINEHEGGLEALITIGLESGPLLTFFDTFYFKNKSLYQVGETYEFNLSAFAYKLEMTGPYVMDLDVPPESKAPQDPKQKEEERHWNFPLQESLKVDIGRMTGIFPVHDEDDDHFFQGRLKNISTFNVGDLKFYAMEMVVVSCLPDNEEVVIPIYAKESLLRKGKIPVKGSRLSGIIWLQGYLAN
jgi:ankyrin repeat protein/TPR repeat protein